MKKSSKITEGWWSRRSLAFCIGVVTVAVTVIVMGTIGTVMTINSQKAATHSVGTEMANSLALTERSLQLMFQSAVEQGKEMMPVYIEALGGIPNTDGTEVPTGEAGMAPRIVTNDGRTLNGDISIQENFRRLTGVDAALVVRDGDSWVLASTLLKDAQGSPQIGSKLAPTDRLATVLDAGQEDAGLIQLNGSWYAMVIKPLENEAGQTFGGLTLRVNVDFDVKNLLAFLERTKIGGHGVMGILSRDTKTGSWVYVGGPRVGMTVSPEAAALSDRMEMVDSGFTQEDLGGGRGVNFVSWTKVPNWNWLLYSSGPKNAFLAASRHDNWVQVLLMVIGTLAIVGATAWLAKKTLRPVNDVMQVLDRLGKGELDFDIPEVPAQSNNEVHRLLQSAEQTRANLAKTVKTVHRSVDEINVGASEILLGNTDLSSRTEQQAASLEETAASMQELASTVRQNAENARQANDMASNASIKAEQGGQAVGDVVGTMQDISASSGRIGEIVNVIDSIAFQTNILALNAAVEAARAGEQGRGFAVVAAEVRALAQRSAVAAKEIKGLIDESLMKISTGAQQVEVTRKTIREVVQAAQQVAVIMGEISSATEQQSAGIDQVNMAVSQMDQVTQQNAALVEQSAAAAASLEDQAKTLANAVAVFKV